MRFEDVRRTPRICCAACAGLRNTAPSRLRLSSPALEIQPFWLDLCGMPVVIPSATKASPRGRARSRCSTRLTVDTGCSDRQFEPPRSRPISYRSGLRTITFCAAARRPIRRRHSQRLKSISRLDPSYGRYLTLSDVISRTSSPARPSHRRTTSLELGSHLRCRAASVRSPKILDVQQPVGVPDSDRASRPCRLRDHSTMVDGDRKPTFTRPPDPAVIIPLTLHSRSARFLCAYERRPV